MDYLKFKIGTAIAAALFLSTTALAQTDRLPQQYEWPVPIYKTNANSVSVVLPDNKDNGGANFYEYEFDWNLSEIGKTKIQSALEVTYPQIYKPFTIDKFSFPEFGKISLSRTLKQYDRGAGRFRSDTDTANLSYSELSGTPNSDLEFRKTSPFVNGRSLLVTAVKVEPDNKENLQRVYTYSTLGQSDGSAQVTRIAQDSLTVGYPRSTGVYPLYDADNTAYGATDGYIIIHGRSPNAKKKRQNPDETLFELVHIDKSGKKVFDTSFNFGEKRRKLNETIFYKSGQNVVMTAQNWSSPESVGSVVFDLQGKEVSRTPFTPIREYIDQHLRRYQETYIGYLPYSEYATPNVDDVRKDENGNIYIFGQQRSREKGLFIAKIKPDFTFDKMNWFNGWASPGQTARSRVIPLKVTEQDVVALVQMPTPRGTVKLIKAPADGALAVTSPLGDGWGLHAKLQTIKFK